MQPKQSPWRTCSDPLRPVSTWPRLKSTPWWRKTATLASSSPPCTWTWPERQVNGRKWRRRSGKALPGQTPHAENFHEELWSYFEKQDVGPPGWRPESTWGCERTLTDWAAGAGGLWPTHVHFTHRLIDARLTGRNQQEMKDAVTQPNYHRCFCVAGNVYLSLIYLKYFFN